MKQGENFAAAWGGISGVQHSLPLLAEGLVCRGQRIETVADLVAHAPADIFGLDTGRLEVGFPADLCRLKRAEATVSKSDLLDRHSHSPYVGTNLSYQVGATWVDGVNPFADA